MDTQKYISYRSNIVTIIQKNQTYINTNLIILIINEPIQTIKKLEMIFKTLNRKIQFVYNKNIQTTGLTELKF